MEPVFWLMRFGCTKTQRLAYAVNMLNLRELTVLSDISNANLNPPRQAAISPGQ